MKTMKAVLTVAIVIAGFAYATHAQNFPGQPPTQDCCSPQPEDFRSYHAFGPEEIIPSVEGENGMIITDVICRTGAGKQVKDCVLSVDTPNNFILTLALDVPNGEFVQSVHFQSGLPVPAGSSVIALISDVAVTVSGYVY